MKKILTFCLILAVIGCGGLEKKWAKKIEFAGSGDYKIYEGIATHYMFYVAGSFRQEGKDEQGVVAAYDKDGKFVWTKFFEDPALKSCRVKEIFEEFGRIYLLVEGEDGAGKQYLFVAACDTLSDLIWQKKIMESDTGKLFTGNMDCDYASNIYIGGSKLNEKDSVVIFLTKLRKSGEEAWSVQYYDPGMKIGKTMFAVMDGSQSVIAGISKDQTNIFYLRYDSFGDLVTMKKLDDPGCSERMLSDVRIDIEKVVYVTGNSRNESTAADFFTAAYGANDSLLWTSCYCGPGAAEDVPLELVLDDSMNLYVIGKSQDAGRTGIVTIRYNRDGSEAWRKVYFDRKSDLSEPFLIASGVLCTAGNDILMLSYNNHGLEDLNRRFRQGRGTNMPVAFKFNYLVLEDQMDKGTDFYLVKFEPSQLGFFRWD